ncbi:MAG: hypothetical protein ABI165_21735 [Bryobacteraceae bacterium]
MARFGFLLLGAATLAAAQPAGGIGIFAGDSDIGNPAIKGSTEFDSAKKEYRISGAGENIWARGDRFHFLWRKISGNVRITATLHFAGTSTTLHRKAGIMLRQSLEPGSAYVDSVVHGNGLTALQVRETTGGITRGFRFPVVAPDRIAPL